MKLIALSALTLFSSISFQAHAALPDGPALIPTVPQRIFTPHGFDSNDRVQVVVDDELASTCYKAGPITHTIDQGKKQIRIQTHSYFYEGCWCAEVVTPFFKEVDLGLLGVGSYRVVAVDGEGRAKQKGSMRVSFANTLAPDDFLYAPVTTASVDFPQNGGLPILTLKGTFSNSCMRLKEIRPTYSPENVVEVLPIAEMDDDDKDCAAVLVPWEQSIPLTNVAKGRNLIHVRSLNGQAVNQVYTF